MKSLYNKTWKDTGIERIPEERQESFLRAERILDPLYESLKEWRRFLELGSIGLAQIADLDRGLADAVLDQTKTIRISVNAEGSDAFIELTEPVLCDTKLYDSRTHSENSSGKHKFRTGETIILDDFVLRLGLEDESNIVLTSVIEENISENGESFLFNRCIVKIDPEVHKIGFVQPDKPPSAEFNIIGFSRVLDGLTS